MKREFFNMKRLIFSLSLAGLLLPWVAVATDATWVNNGTIATPINIDATNVVNNGIIGPLITTSLFDTSNTKNFTNAGTISGSVGFRFDTAPRNSSGQLIGVRRLAENFNNRNSGTVSALVGTTIAGFLSAQLYVEATNILNQGTVTVGADGLLQVTGTNVNLSRGAAGVQSIDNSASIFSVNDSPANGQFVPATAVTDNYWAQTNANFRVDGLISEDGIVTTPPHTVQAVAAAGGYINQNNVVLSLGSYYSDAISNVLRYASVTVTNIDGGITNFLVPSNIVQQAVFANVAPDDFSTVVTIDFVPTTLPTNNYFSTLVTAFIPVTNVLTGQSEYSQIYFQDTLAGEQDRGLLVNYLTTLGGLGVTTTLRPRAYILSRAQQQVGFGGNALIDSGFFYRPNFATNRVDGAFAAYSGRLDNIVLRPPILPGIPAESVTNFSGRIEVRSDSLDMTRARIRGEGLVLLQTRHLVGSSNAAVDCENLSLDLGSTNGLLRIQDITKTSVGRVRGDVFAWSAQWSNSFSLVITNYGPPPASTNEPPATNLVYMPITNTVNVEYHMMAYDLSGVATSVPATVQHFRASATNIVMNDRASVNLELVLKGESFTLNGQMALTGGLLALTEGVADWRVAAAPTLRHFTNNGTLTIANEAHFGDDTAQNYLSFVNRGTIQSRGQAINSSYTELAGTNISFSTISVSTTDGKVENGTVTANGDIFFQAGTLKFHRAFVNSANRLYFTATNSLFDNGASSSNRVFVRDGFVLTGKPVGPGASDLLGTTIQSSAPNFAEVEHYWGAQNFGPNNNGFFNNVAVGRLVLSPEGFDPYFYFAGASGGGTINGLYVDELDLSQLSDYANQIEIDPSLIIYYAAAKLSFTPGGGLSAEEFLDGQFGGRLRWVSTYAGPNSSVDVLINGNQTVKVNKALRNSTVIDSDSDGIPNFFDPTPFDGVNIISIQRSLSPAGYLISWDAAPNTVYRLEYRTNHAVGSWTVLLQTTNTASVPAPWSALDSNVAPGEQRYYRVTYNPNGL